MKYGLKKERERGGIESVCEREREESVIEGRGESESGGAIFAKKKVRIEVERSLAVLFP